MSNVFFISDLHLGHKKILEFSPMRGGTCNHSHSDWLVDQWNSVVGKRDVVWVLGDVCFDKNHLKYLKKMNGHKHLILGNHDEFSFEVYRQYFNKIHSLVKYKGFWLSHAPIHPDELRGKINIHGHVHNKTISITTPYYNDLMRSDDNRYFNVCVEANLGVPVSLESIIKQRNIDI